ncbi:dimeric dihydrodiol [Trichoderma arundinaceum]|uniref:Dimeric dihydrodiol n=1 Tax=Trichoderma arundinaceum TaxID=490622 RepID=A0A395NWV8_TRIAR|nr:dimeric dihydrodiol [Trichoderma arundinaceum]
MGQLHTLIHEDKVIGTVSRMYCDFGCDVTSLPTTSRVKNPKLGGGALLDLGIYPLTISNLILDGKVGDEALNPEIASAMTIVGDVDNSVAMIVNYSSKKCLGILSASLETTSEKEFCRIEGSEGIITLSGPMAAKPEVIKIRRYQEGIDDVRVFSHPGTGLYFEANAVAQDIMNGKIENAVVPLAETIRLSKMMDKIRKYGGVLYSQDL